jgi:pilus assembly protein Flp/PilA
MAFVIPTVVQLYVRQLRREDGQTLAEYGILVAVIAIIVIVAATVFGGSVSTLFSSNARRV